MKNLSFLTSNLIAHRGLHNNKTGIIENSMEAFEIAIKKKYIIELDVHLLKDGEVIVFHDDNLKRLTGKDLTIKELTYSEIKEIKLGDTNVKIPKFKEVLKLVDGKVPLLIELKYDTKTGKLERKVIELLENYKGQYALQSFHPFSIRWLKKNAPDIIRGQLSCDFKKENMNIIKKYILKNMVFNFIGKPDFISYDIHDLTKKRANQIRKKRLLLGWTVEEKEQYENLKGDYDNLICEKFLWE